MRSRARRPAVGLAVIVAVVATAPDSAWPKPPDEPLPGAVVFLRDARVWQIPADTSAPARPIATLPAGVTTGRTLRASASGRLIVLDLDGATGWVQLPADTYRTPRRQVALAPCAGPAYPSADGTELTCRDAPATVVIQPITWIAHTIAGAGPVAGFLGPTTDELVVIGPRTIEAVSRDGAHRRLLAPHRPARALLVAPDGTRAVGVYDGGDGVTTVTSFRLDGRAAQRTIGEDLSPRAWSPDSRWVLLDHPRRACLARAVGGEYKCWEHYRAVGFGPDSRHILLAQAGALFIAPIEGVHPSRPHQIVDRAGAAVWIRRPATTPQSSVP